MDLPSINSPKTPATPASPVDITIRRESDPEEIISFTDCQELAKTVRFCSKSLIEGNWVDVPDIRGGKPRFIPSNFESAKAYLRASVEVLPSARRVQPNSDTPLTSHPRSEPEMGVCHACHGPIGGGAHQGSAPGKGICSHKHSHFCKGGISENLSWAPCPSGYIYNPDLDLASGTGFESTLHTFNFRAGSQQNGPSSSTPAADDINVYPDNQQQVSLPPQIVDRFPGIVNSDRRQLSREFPDPDLRTPGIVHMDRGASGGVSPAHQVNGVPENIQNRID